MTSFYANYIVNGSQTVDEDQIIVFNIRGEKINSISVDSGTGGEPQSWAQALIFGPQGYLFVPVSGET